MIAYTGITHLYDSELFGEGLKNIFGNRKNYERYLASKRFNDFKRWMILMGYRP